ncbi:MAG: FAD:protein FMN transferase [Candidatus Aminicenantes bacterium]|nr:FAD:protein FMN transferase [Candidatus Aminicenantes bacterium]
MTEKKTFSFSHQAMATFFEVFVAGHDEAYARSAAHEFFREIDRLEEFFSRFDERSEISRINRLRPGEVLPVSLETYECLKLSFEMMVETGGAFNVNFRALRQEFSEIKAGERKVKSWDERSGKRERQSSRQGLEPTETGKIEFRSGVEGSEKAGKTARKKYKNRDEEQMAGTFGCGVPVSSSKQSVMNLTFGAYAENKKIDLKPYLRLFPLDLVEQAGGYGAVRLNIPDVVLDLDLGAIGKGYALEKAVRIFEAWEITDFLVSAGGSTVYACGSEPWPVSVGGGFDFFQPGKIYLKERALSGSGHEVKGEHIFDPRKKCQKSRHLAAWVSHPSPAVADVLSTAFMAMGLEEISKYTESHPEVWALVLTRNKKSHRFKEVEFFEKGD